MHASETAIRPCRPRGQWLLALMVVAATAVIVVSLFGIARMTGLIPYTGSSKHETETMRDKTRDAPKDREGVAPDGRRPTPTTVPDARPRRRFA